MVYTPPPRPSQLSQRHTADNFVALQSCFIVAQPSAGSITFTDLPGNQPVTFKFFNDGSSGNTAYACGSSSAASGGAVAAVASTTNPTSATQLMGFSSGNTQGYSISNNDALPAGAVLTQDYIMGTDTISVITPAGYSCKIEISMGYGQ